MISYKSGRLSPVWKERGIDVVTYVVLMVIAMITLIPIIWAASTSFKPPAEVLSRSSSLIPRHPSFENYRRALETAPFLRFLLNTALVSLISVGSVLVTSSIAGYVFAKYNMWWIHAIFFAILVTIMVPLQCYVIQLFLFVNSLRWVNTYQGLVFPLLIHTAATFFMRQNILSIPDEMLEAARIDGCSEFGIYLRIILPLSRSALGAVAIISCIDAWTAFLWPLMILSDTEKYTTELGLTMFQKLYYVDYGPLMAASFFSFLPVLVIFLILRRQIIEATTLTGLKQ